MKLIRDSRAAAIAVSLAVLAAAFPVIASAEESVKEKRVIVLNDIGKVFVSGEDEGGPAASRGYSGVQLVELTPDLRGYFGVANDTGVLVSGAVKGSPRRKRPAFGRETSS